ncbi:MAG: CBS domain-containing protein [Myxococcales bacterium]|nr:CBS domain-containing protein [Myxococcales bacterium]
MKARDLMTHHVRTCRVGDTLAEAARIMWEGDLGDLPVVDEEGRVVAMITDRDICMAAYTQGVPLVASSVSSAMSKRLVSCSPHTSLHEIEQKMLSAQVRRIPVIDELGLLVGIVTLGDIARHTQSGSLLERFGAAGVTKTLSAVSERRPN